MAENTAVPTVQLGQSVIYVGSKGLPKQAFVVGTPESVEEGHSLPTLSEGQLYLTVWEFSAGHYVPKGPVAFEGQVEGNVEFQNSDGTSINVWRLV